MSGEDAGELVDTLLKARKKRAGDKPDTTVGIFERNELYCFIEKDGELAAMKTVSCHQILVRHLMVGILRTHIPYLGEKQCTYCRLCTLLL